MKKHNLFLLSAVLLCSVQNAFAYDMGDGVWKNLIGKYDQTTDNKQLVSGMLTDRLYYNDTYSSNNRKNVYSDTFLKGRYGVNFRLDDHFSVKIVSKFEKVTRSVSDTRRNASPTGSGDRSFENEALFLDEMVLGYDYEKFSALAGKIAPNFGDAWRSSDGIWLNELAKATYEKNQKLGLGAIQRFGDQKTIGEYVFGASAFTNDRKNFDNSTVTPRDGVSKSAGKPGDTRNLDSYVLSTDIYYDFGNNEKLSYHFSYINSAINPTWNTANVDKSKLNDETAFATNVNYKYPVTKTVLFNGFVEFVKINNLGGDSEQDAKLLTINLTTNIKDFFVTVGRATEQDFKIGGNGVDKHINEVSVGYKFDHVNKYLKGLSLMVGLKQDAVDSKTSNVSNQGYGIQLAHKIEF